MALNQELIEKANRHSVYVQRFAGGLDNKFEPFLERLKVAVAGIVATTSEATPIPSLRSQLTNAQRAIYDEYEQQLNADLAEFAVSESEYEARTLNTVMDDEVESPAAAEVVAELAAAVMVIGGIAKTNAEAIRDWTVSETQRITGIATSGVITGQSTRDIIRTTNTTFDNNVVRNNKTIVSTTTNHSSSVGREQTMLGNVIGYRWISILDSKTSTTCKSLDHQVFLFSDQGFKPKPPAHQECRSSIAAELDGRKNAEDSRSNRPSKGDEGREPVGATSTYYGWLKRQNAAFQDQAIGPTRGKLLRNGGLTSEEFRRLSVDQRYQPLNLDEMRARDPEAFEEAGL